MDSYMLLHQLQYDFSEVTRKKIAEQASKGDSRRMSRNGKWAGVELAIFLMIQIQQNYTSLYS